MLAVIMAAGRSTRTYPLTLTRPKPLLPVANRPILAHQLDALRGIAGRVVVIVGYRREMIEEAFGAEYDGLPITYVEQKEMNGTGHAVLQCAGTVEEDFIVLNGDDLYDPRDLRRLADRPDTALVREVDDPRRFGVYEVATGGKVVRLVEKPTEPASNLANIGAYHFTPAVFDILRGTPPSERGEIELTSAVQALAESTGFHTVRQEGYWLPVGYPWHLLDANLYLLRHHFEPRIEGTVEDGVTMTGPVGVGAGTVLRPGVVIEGPVLIGRDCKVGPNAYLRPGTTIGNGCHVGQAVELKNTILFDRANVPHLSYVGDSVIGERSNLGAGTITANLRHDGRNIRSAVKGDLVDSGRRKFGAIVGDDVHTGIHTSILPGRKFWPNTSTYPGQVVDRDVVE
jgi:bifunctional UDP-N-acetylglucosamine pyrophosphorylase/glucosamine-1-phosphate N-acetyltransferase